MGIARAVYQNFRRGRIVEGGSTITQQLAKVLFLTPDRSLDRKLKEAVLAVELERRYSKDRILEMYLNQIYFGHGAFGVEAASRTFFGKPSASVPPDETARSSRGCRRRRRLLAFEHPEAAMRRRGIVLTAHVGYGRDEAETGQASRRDALPWFRRSAAEATGQVLPRVRSAVSRGPIPAPNLVFKGGLHATPRFHPDSSQGGILAARRTARAPDAPRLGGRTRSGASGAARWGAPRPRAADRLYPSHGGRLRLLKSEFNRAVQARRRRAAFKPFVYMAALESGQTRPAWGRLAIQYPLAAGKILRPDNYDRSSADPSLPAGARRRSINVAAIRVQERTGIRRTVDIARRPRRGQPAPGEPSIALGTSDLTLLELTSAYGALANQGTWIRPTAIRYILDAQHKLLEENVPQGRQALSPDLAYVITHMMEGTVERGTGQAAKALGRPIAAKTGTTNDYSNAWFIGFTPTLATGVWVGYDRPRSLGRTRRAQRGHSRSDELMKEA